MTTPDTPAAPSVPGSAGLKVLRPTNGYLALGMAVSFLMADPAFQRLRFGHWARVLGGQIRRRHFLFVIDRDKVVGFAGWALTQKDKAEQWLAGRAELSLQDCLDGDFVIINAWKAATPEANQAIVDTFRQMFAAKQALYFKRFYADGRVRPSRLNVNAFVSRHLAATRARPGNPADAADIADASPRQDPPAPD